MRVHVAVPHAVAADDDDRVAELAPRAPELGDRVVGRVQEEHDLVAQVGHVRVRQVRGDGRGCRDDLGLGDRPLGDDVEARGEEQLETAPAGVDDARVAQDGQELRRARDRVGRRAHRPVEDVAQRGFACRVRLLDRLGGEPDDREDGSLDRSEHRLVGRIGGAAESRHDVMRADAFERRERVRQPPQDLRQDHTRVAARAHQRAVPDCFADVAHRRVRGGGQLADDGFDREGHVRPRVAVGDGVHVEPVELVLVQPQHVAVRRHDAPEVGRCQRLQDPHGWDGIRLAASLLRSADSCTRSSRWRPSAKCVARSRSSACV